MILITGGLGFIGSHVARALLDLGETCVVTRRRTARVPEFLADEAGGRLLVEPVDVTDQDALLALGKRHTVSGIVHLAGAGIGAGGTLDALTENTRGLLSVLRAAEVWEVPRVGIASTIGVYGGVPGDRLREDAPLPTASPHMIPAAKKAMEILALRAAADAGFAVVNFRIAAIWGPLGRAASPFFATPRLVHAAVNGEDPGTLHAEDGIDMCYVKDCGRAIALLQTAGTLRHDTYNVGNGYATTNAEVAAAIRAVVPEARVDLSTGHDPAGPGATVCLDTERIREDTGYRPRYDVERAVADYVAWLRAGNER
ncbi:NAD-dependent epimerase/dehydratase family protein [Actinoallomurus iriomotensis]|uniref:NAD-dependent epimerase n=1 Tax=Actinoallomurus iriomotensis TaxID=478107 RepID=A0A9W6RHY0_9ACTN|nr:NAD(P)-dependent oxidoreductase [Actinoallomurus iriomotensis]GLY74367.1 NAD-dependent epimerase [Actinoallomurus iriomotensis]